MGRSAVEDALEEGQAATRRRLPSLTAEVSSLTPEVSLHNLPYRNLKAVVECRSMPDRCLRHPG